MACIRVAVDRRRWRPLALASALAPGLLTLLAAAAEGGEPSVARLGPLAALTLPAGAAAPFAYAEARPLPLPATAAPPPPLALEMQPAMANAALAAPGSVAGGTGDGRRAPAWLLPLAPSATADTAADTAAEADNVAAGRGTPAPPEPKAFGSARRPFTTARVDPRGEVITDSHPFRATGKLFVMTAFGESVCSAALIGPGLVVTAAHCVAVFGAGRFHTDFRFVPAYRNGHAPYGAWPAAKVWVLASYLDGTDPCAADAVGVVCRNDVAVIALKPRAGRYPGTATGWYGHGWNGYGFAPAAIAQVTQLGYSGSLAAPSQPALDGGERMQRTDALANVAVAAAGNTLIGTLMAAGSSGGPWLVNLGVAPVLANTTAGAEAARNIVVGVTSWGYGEPTIKEQGASPFLSGNIVRLVKAACAFAPAACP